jgi:hypothetical protein
MAGRLGAPTDHVHTVNGTGAGRAIGPHPATSHTSYTGQSTLRGIDRLALPSHTSDRSAERCTQLRCSRWLLVAARIRRSACQPLAAFSCHISALAPSSTDAETTSEAHGLRSAYALPFTCAGFAATHEPLDPQRLVMIAPSLPTRPAGAGNSSSALRAWRACSLPLPSTCSLTIS